MWQEESMLRVHWRMVNPSKFVVVQGSLQGEQVLHASRRHREKGKAAAGEGVRPRLHRAMGAKRRGSS